MWRVFSASYALATKITTYRVMDASGRGALNLMIATHFRPLSWGNARKFQSKRKICPNLSREIINFSTCFLVSNSKFGLVWPPTPKILIWQKVKDASFRVQEMYTFWMITLKELCHGSFILKILALTVRFATIINLLCPTLTILSCAP